MARAFLLALLLLCGASQVSAGSVIADGKLLPDGRQLPPISVPVTYKGSGFYYVQEKVGTPGIRVELAGVGVEPGLTVMITPYIYTNSRGERYLGGC
jgi:hypothetical protein